jgi:predicted GH43/DUF377 family glycosyl hydrolase
MLKRYSHNPILRGQKNTSWRSKKVYNASVLKVEDEYTMIFRAIGDDWISRLGMAKSSDGFNFIPAQNPVLEPVHIWEQKGCEDPRITKIDGTYWACYTAFDGLTARAAITSSKDLTSWGERHLLFPDLSQEQRENLPGAWSKGAAIFPEKINGRYMLLYGDSRIWPAYSDDLATWEPSDIPFISARDGYFDEAYVEMGPPPIKTENGWLVLYHGIDEFTDNRTYGIGAILLDLEDPLNILWRSSKPILTPTEKYETVGMIDIVAGGFSALKNMSPRNLFELAAQKRLPKAVFCCGAILEGDTLRIYYGAADTVICTATVDLDSLFAS